MLNIYVKFLSPLDPLPITILDILSRFVFNKKGKNIKIKYNKFSPLLFFQFDSPIEGNTSKCFGCHVVIAMYIVTITNVCKRMLYELQ